MYLKTIIIDFCTWKYNQTNKKQQDPIFYITQEKSKLTPNIEKINKYQQELNEIENYKTEGTIIRSKEKVRLNEEKPTKYFYTQEKKTTKNKNITTLIDEKGNILQKNTDILNECKNYYQKLYINQNTSWHTKTIAPTNSTKSFWNAKPTTHKTNTNNRNTTSLTNYGKREITRDGRNSSRIL